MHGVDAPRGATRTRSRSGLVARRGDLPDLSAQLPGLRTATASAISRGVIARLPYIASLGVDAIWISPFFKSPMKDFGYDVSDYRDVDPMFGTLADFDALVAGGASARPARDDRRGDVAHRRHPSLVQGEPVEPQQSQGRLVCLGGRQAGRHAAQQLAVDLRRLGLAVGHAPPAILPAQFPGRAAGPQLPQQGSAGRAARRHPLLARPRRRRLPARHDQLLLPQPGAGEQSAAAGRRAQRPDRAGGQSVQLPGPSLRQEPAGKPRLPRTLSRPARRISGGSGGRRSRRLTARPRSRRGIYRRRNPRADVLRLRLPGAGEDQRREGAFGARSLRPGRQRRLVVLGLLQP